MHKPIVELEQQIASLQVLVGKLQATDSITSIDKDLLKQRCIELYELILTLPTAGALAPKPEADEIIPTLHQIKQETIPDVVLLNDLPVKEEPLFEAPDLFAATLKTETEIRNEEIEQIIEEVKQQEPEVSLPPLTKEEVQEISLHEKIAFAMPVKPDLSEKLSSGVIASLKSAINVNLKIAIVNDLFKENTVEYVKAIDKLNNSENIHEAMRYFTELKHIYDWDNQNTLVKELESLINKRFS